MGVQIRRFLFDFFIDKKEGLLRSLQAICGHRGLRICLGYAVANLP